MLVLDDALYGLRNLSVMDDEETRVTELTETIEPAELRDQVLELINAGDFSLAYTKAILPQLKGYTREAIKEAAIGWAMRFDEEESYAISNDMMAVYDSIMSKDAEENDPKVIAAVNEAIANPGKVITFTNSKGQRSTTVCVPAANVFEYWKQVFNDTPYHDAGTAGAQ